MKLLLTGDIHYTDKAPRTRTDDYLSELHRKIMVLKNHNLTILQPGDLTDTPFLSYLTFRRLLSILQGITILSVYGQHDLRYRNKGNTPVDTLKDACSSFHIADAVPYELEKNVYLYGASFEEEIPKITTASSYNILLIHRMISPIKSEDWHEEEALPFLKKHKFNLIISGDNHKSFEAKHNYKRLINCGSLMRSKIDQIDHKPCYYIFDTKTERLEKHFIPITDGDKVFDMNLKEEKAERNEDLEAFVSGLSKQKEMGLNIQNNLIAYMKKNKIGEDIQNIIRENSI
jgi:predicted phosphodiesterase